MREVKFNPNNKYLFAAGYETGNVEIFDLRKNEILTSNNIHNRSVLTVDWNPLRADILATGSTEKTIKAEFFICSIIIIDLGYK